MVYRTHFQVPAAWGVQSSGGKRVKLNFQAVDWQAEVWVDGRKMGDHRGG